MASRALFVDPKLCLVKFKPFESNMVVTLTNRVAAASEALIPTGQTIWIELEPPILGRRLWYIEFFLPSPILSYELSVAKSGRA